jgi:hypothetical protein
MAFHVLSFCEWLLYYTKLIGGFQAIHLKYQDILIVVISKDPIKKALM